MGANKFNRFSKVVLDRRTTIEGLKMVFNVERIAGDAFAKMKLDIYNSDIRNVEFSEGGNIELYAGYINNNSIIFSGTAFNIRTRREGTETITTVFAHDNNGSLFDPQLNKSYKNQTSVQAIIEDMARSIDLRIADNKIKSAGISGRYILSGRFSSEMNRLARTFNFTWHIVNGQLYLYDNETGNRESGILEVSAATGLLETPVRTEKGVFIKMLLEPSVKAMDRFKVESTGIVDSRLGVELMTRKVEMPIQRVISITHNGDTHGDTWYTQLDGQDDNN